MLKRLQHYSNYLLPLIILLGISFVLFYHAAEMLHAHKDNPYGFHGFAGGLEDYRNFTVAWRGRLFTNALAAVAIRAGASILYRTDVLLIETPLELSVALWTAAWFFTLGLLYIWKAGFRSLFFIFGSYAAIAFGYMPRSLEANRIYPWDMPAMFIFVAFLVLFLQKKYRWLLVLIPLSVGFKETVLLLCLGFLFTELPWKTRLKMTFASMALGIAIKLLIDSFMHVPMPFLTMETSFSPGFQDSYIYFNLSTLLDMHPFLINAGTLLVFFLLPNFDRTMVGLKVIALLFVFGNLVFGLILEYRIFFELIPFSLYGIERVAYGKSALRYAD